MIDHRFQWTIIGLIALLLMLGGILPAKAERSVGLSAPGLLDTKAPQDTVIRPGSGAIFHVGEEQAVWYVAEDSNFSSRPLGFAFRTRPTAPWVMIDSLQANVGAYLWRSIPPMRSDSVQVRVCAADSLGNRGCAFSPRFTVTTDDRLGPELILLVPPDSGWESCESLIVLYRIVDPSGLNPATILVQVGESLRAGPDPRFTASHDTLRLAVAWSSPPESLTTIRILRVADLVGNYADSFPTVAARQDRETPTVALLGPNPDSVLTRLVTPLTWLIRDSLSGVDRAATQVYINGAPWRPPDGGDWAGDTLRLYPVDFGSRIVGDSALVCLGILDQATLCGANRTPWTCRTFRFMVHAPEWTGTIPPAGTPTACRRPEAAWLVSSPNDLVLSAATISLGDSLLSRGDFILEAVGDSVRFFPLVDLPYADSLVLCLNGVTDSLFNPGQDLPWCLWLRGDTLPPAVGQMIPVPGEVVNSDQPEIRLRIDDPSGFVDTSLSLSVDTFFVHPGDPGWSMADGWIVFRPAEAGLRLPGEGTVQVCLATATDGVVDCGPNVLTAPDCRSFRVDVLGPRVGLLEPPEGSVIGCDTVTVSFGVVDEQGISPTSVSITANGSPYRLGDGYATYEPGRITLRLPPARLHDGNARVCLEALNDPLGNPATGLPLCVNFSLDRTAPIVAAFQPAPGSFLGNASPTVGLLMSSGPAPLSTESLAVSVNGVRHEYGGAGLRLTDSLLSVDLSGLGVTLTDGESLRVCLVAARDVPDLCPAHRLTAPQCATWNISLSGPQVTFLRPLEGESRACQDSLFLVLATAASGIDTASARLTLNGVPLSRSWHGDTLRIRTSLPPEGTDSLCLTSLRDQADVSAAGLPRCVRWLADRTPPSVATFLPPNSASVPSQHPEIRMVWRDAAGFDPTSVVLLLESDTLRWPSSALNMAGDTLILTTAATGRTWTLGEILDLTILAAADRTGPCGPNRLRSPISYNLAITAVGPQANLLGPPPGEVNSCPRQPVRFRIVAAEGADTSSIRLNVLGTDVVWPDPRLRLAGDTLTFTPSTDWTDGDSARVCLTGLTDRYGTPSPDLPVCTRFLADRAGPAYLGCTPASGTAFGDVAPLLRLIMSDRAGLDASSLRLYVGDSLYTASAPFIDFRGETLVVDLSDPSLTWTGEDTVRLSLQALSDRAVGCGENALPGSVTLAFPYDRLPPRIVWPESLETQVRSCSLQVIPLNWTDATGLDTASLRLRVNGIPATATSPNVRVGPDLIEVTPPEPLVGTGTWEVCLDSVSDPWGQPVPGLPVCRTYRYDRVPPELVLRLPTPGDGLREPVDTLRLLLADTPAGLDIPSIRWRIRDRVFTSGDRGIALRGDTLLFVPGEVGFTFWEEDSVSQALLAAADLALGCGANALRDSVSWFFRVLDDDTTGPTFGGFNPNYAVAEAEIRVSCLIMDPSGVYDDFTGSEGQGVFLIWDTDGELDSTRNEIQMAPGRHVDPEDTTLFIAQEAIPGQPTGTEVIYRVGAWDNDFDHSRPSDRRFAFSPIRSIRIVTNLGPRPILLDPPSGIVSACVEESIRYVVESTNGINWSTLSVSLDDLTLHYGDPQLLVRESLVTVVAGTRPDGDTVRSVFLALRDTLGNPALSTPAAWFLTDHAGPRIIGITPLPGQTIEDDTTRLTIRLRDAAPISTDSLRLAIGLLHLQLPGQGLTWSNGTLTWAPAAAGWIWPNDTTLTIRLGGLWDLPDRCGPNHASDSLWSVPVHYIPRLPDLDFDATPVLPGTIREGDQVTAVVSVINRGTNPSPVCNLVLDGSTGTDTLALSRTTLLPLAPGQSRGAYLLFGAVAELRELIFRIDPESTFQERNRRNNLLTLPISVGLFGVEAAPNPFTPNDDGVGDRVSFHFPKSTQREAEVEIFDRKLHRVNYIGRGEDYSWDGRDLDGRPVLPGVYLYTIRSGNQIIGNGTIILAR